MLKKKKQAPYISSIGKQNSRQRASPEGQEKEPPRQVGHPINNAFLQVGSALLSYSKGRALRVSRGGGRHRARRPCSDRPRGGVRHVGARGHACTQRQLLSFALLDSPSHTKK